MRRPSRPALFHYPRNNIACPATDNTVILCGRDEEQPVPDLCCCRKTASFTSSKGNYEKASADYTQAIEFVEKSETPEAKKGTLIATPFLFSIGSVARFMQQRAKTIKPSRISEKQPNVRRMIPLLITVEALSTKT